jgi:hypothetical protein
MTLYEKEIQQVSISLCLRWFKIILLELLQVAGTDSQK